MKTHEANTSRVRGNAAPLFSSVWLALFNELRKLYVERRLEANANTNCSPS